MLAILSFFANLIISLFKSPKTLRIENLLLKKENEILKRKLQTKRIIFTHTDKIILTLLNLLENIKNIISIVKPETLLKWQRILIRYFWFAVTQNPVREFVRQQIIEFENIVNQTVYLIRDNSRQFDLDFIAYGIKDIRTSVYAPDMNSIAERFIRSVRTEALDNFIIFNEGQLFRILSEYIKFYNSLRHHQGINQNTPKGYVARSYGKVLKRPVLAGVCYHYFREAA
jgi:hypothetical protein